MNASQQSTSPAIPATLEALLGSIDEIIGRLPDSTPHRTEFIRGASGAIARLGLALEPWPGLPEWAALERLDGLFLHRHWSLDQEGLAPGLGVVASHDGFDRRFGFADNPDLCAALGVEPEAGLAERDGYPLGTVASGGSRSAERLAADLVAIFGGLEEGIAGPPGREISRLAFARAMTADLVQEAASLGAQAYVTGQLRRPAIAAAARAGMHIFAVGHRRSERWALRALAAELVQRWPGLSISVAPDAYGTAGAVPARAGP